MNTGITTRDETLARERIYGFLASVFTSHPTQDSVRALYSMAEGLGIGCSSDFPLAELDREYMELFVVPNPRYIAPYESVFRDHWLLPAVLKRGSNPAETGRTIKGLLMGESTLQVRDYYLRAGILPDEDLPDHIGNELRFMAYTWKKDAETTTAPLHRFVELREKFRREHLLKWIGQLREKIAERERLGYYVTAIKVAEALLQDEEN